MGESPRNNPFKVGDFVETNYNKNTGIIYQVYEIREFLVFAKPYLDPCGNFVTKKHGYHKRILGYEWFKKKFIPHPVYSK